MQGDDEWRVVTTEVDPATHMALDEIITQRVASGESPPTLRFWTWDRPTVVIGRFQAVRDEVFMDMAERHGVQVVRRSTGGGAMFCEPGDVITYSLSLPDDYVESASIVDSYRELEEWTLEALDGIGVDASHRPINDIVHGDRKIGGSAQARRDAVLHHTMLAYDLDIAKMLKVLKIGEEKISDKAIRSAEKAVAPIRTLADVPRGEVIDRMVESFAQGRHVAEGSLHTEEISDAEVLAAETYATDDWLEHVDRDIEGFDV